MVYINKMQLLGKLLKKKRKFIKRKFIRKRKRNKAEGGGKEITRGRRRIEEERKV